MPNDKPNWFMEHEKSDNENFGMIRQTLTDIKENHLAHIQIAMEVQANEIAWIKWIAVGIVGGIGAIIVALIVALIKQFV